MLELFAGRMVYDPPRFMTINEAIAQLLEVEAKRGGGGGFFTQCMNMKKMPTHYPRYIVDGKFL